MSARNVPQQPEFPLRSAEVACSLAKAQAGATRVARLNGRPCGESGENRGRAVRAGAGNRDLRERVFDRQLAELPTLLGPLRPRLVRLAARLPQHVAFRWRP